MTLSILAVLFIILLIAVVFYGYGFVVKSTKRAGEENNESCAICRKSYVKRELVEREIGDYKLLYFCQTCIETLYRDSGRLG